MKRENKGLFAITAVLMAVILTFSTQMQIAAPALNLNKNTAFVRNEGEENMIMQAEEHSDYSESLLSVDGLSEKYGNVDNTYHSPAPVKTLSDDVIADLNSGNSDDITVVAPVRPDEKEGVSIVPIAVNNIIRDALASIISSKVYTFSVTERGVLVYAFNHTQGTAKGCSWNITLYEEYSPDGTGNQIAYRELNQTEYKSVGTGVQSGAIGVLPGNYRIVVECISGFTDENYDIVAAFTQMDDYEIECNDTQSRYTYLPLDKTISGSASTFSDSSKKDTDWYMFEITEKGYAVLYFDHEADTASTAQNIAWKLRIVDVDGNEYYAEDSSMETTSLNSGIMGLPVGIYFISVSSHMFSEKQYMLTVSFTADTSIESEFNDTPETANPLKVNTEMIGSLTKRDLVSDRDYYVFSMENDGFVSVGFTHEALSQQHDGWNVTILSENGDVIYREVSDWSVSVLETPQIGLSAGKYYVLVDSDSLYLNSIVYRIVLLKTEDNTWESEPNNTMDSADVLTMGTTVNGTMVAIGVDYDKDYFKFSVNEAGTLKIAFGHVVTDEAKEGWIVSLLDSQGKEIQAESVNWNEFEKTFEVDVEAGSYYILIESGLYFNSNAYLLNVQL